MAPFDTAAGTLQAGRREGPFWDFPLIDRRSWCHHPGLIMHRSRRSPLTCPAAPSGRAAIAAAVIPCAKSPARLTLRMLLGRLLADCRLGCRDFRLHGIEVEARALLHRRELDRRHGQLRHLLLDKHEAPEFVLEPVEVLLRPSLVPLSGQPVRSKGSRRRLVRYGHVGLGLVAEPAAGLVDEAILEVVDAHRTECRFRRSRRFRGGSTAPCR